MPNAADEVLKEQRILESELKEHPVERKQRVAARLGKGGYVASSPLSVTVPGREGPGAGCLLAGALTCYFLRRGDRI
jgi:hypothetical protein